MTLKTGYEDPTACACSPDGRSILSACHSHLWLWDARSGELTWDAQPRALSVWGCALSRTARASCPAALEFPEKAVTLWDLRSRRHGGMAGGPHGRRPGGDLLAGRVERRHGLAGWDREGLERRIREGDCEARRPRRGGECVCVLPRWRAGRFGFV